MARVGGRTTAAWCSTSCHARRWLNRDPEAAAKFLFTLPSGHRLRNEGFTALKLWRERSPEEALAWAEGHSLATYGHVAREYLAEQLAQEAITPKEVLDLALTTTSTRLRGDLSSKALYEQAESDVEGALTWAAEHLPNSGIGEGLVSAYERAHRDDREAQESVRRIVSRLAPSFVKGSAAKRVAYSQIFDAPDEVLAWIDGLDQRTQDEAMQRIELNFPTSEKGREWLVDAPETPFAEQALIRAVDHLLREGSKALAELEDEQSFEDIRCVLPAKLSKAPPPERPEYQDEIDMIDADKERNKALSQKTG